MYHVFILTDREIDGSPIPWAMEMDGLSYDVGTEGQLDNLGNGDQLASPDAVLLDLDSVNGERAHKVASRCRDLGLPVLALVSADRLMSYDRSLGVDDFILQPLRHGELSARLSQAMVRTRDSQGQRVIRSGDLLVDLDRYEVRLASKRVLLTYKEYQLLVLLASNPGKVYTRDGLLSEVWGYDYFGGTRTVDVHVRRLRSKIDDARHSFIETVWNVGYRFRAVH